ncbi:MAG: molecular chaperone GrpE [Oceanospirillaceae bacterium]|jgi:molecular chaperone GrpE
MSDQQDKPANTTDEDIINPVDSEQTDNAETTKTANDELVEAIEAEFIAKEADPLAGLDMIKQLSEAQAEIANLKDQMLRTVADAQNTKRRAEQDVTKAHKFGTEKFANEMLPIVDSLAMALLSNADDEASKSIKEGVEMTLNMLITALEKFNVVQIDPQAGDVFDPSLHQAMSMIDGGEIASNSVVAAMQKGFTINGRLLRPAMVMVAK